MHLNVPWYIGYGIWPLLLPTPYNSKISPNYTNYVFEFCLNNHNDTNITRSCRKSFNSFSGSQHNLVGHKNHSKIHSNFSASKSLLCHNDITMLKFIVIEAETVSHELLVVYMLSKKTFVSEWFTTNRSLRLRKKPHIYRVQVNLSVIILHVD